MRRRNSNKRRSMKAARSRHSKTARVNLASPRRGGIRL